MFVIATIAHRFLVFGFWFLVTSHPSHFIASVTGVADGGFNYEFLGGGSGWCGSRGLVCFSGGDHLLDALQQDGDIRSYALPENLKIQGKVRMGDEISHAGDFSPRDVGVPVAHLVR